MRNIFLIARREYLERVRTKAFIVSVVLFPVLMALCVAVPAYIASKGAGQKNIVFVTDDAVLGQALVGELASDKDTREMSVTVDAPAESLRPQLNEQVQTKKIDGYLWMGDKPAYYSNSAGDLELVGTLEDALQRALAHQQLGGHGVSSAEVHAIFAPVHIDMRLVRNGMGANALSTYIAAIVLMIMLYGSLMFQGNAVSQSVVEEKTSRIFEVMLAMVSPKEMLAGKLLGVGAVGLTQVSIWLVAGVLLSSPGVAMMHASSEYTFHLSAWNVVTFVICFLLGFLFYSALAAMLGSMVNSNQEAQQLSPFINMPLILCVLLFQAVLSDPSGRWATILSLLPPFAPLLMYLRIMVQTPPVWQIALSLVLMLGGVWLVIALASRIYRVGILMYGKRPTMPELLRWLKYS